MSDEPKKRVWGLGHLPPAERRRIAAMGGRTHGIGHKRCPCGVYTLARAKARGRENVHQPTCPFYKPGRMVYQRRGASAA